MPPPTILAHKTDFLNAQTLQLSQALTPSNAWRRASNKRRAAVRSGDKGNENDSATPLSEKAVDDALYRLNHALLQHSRRVYAPQATRHVAEQIEALYLEAGERGVRAGDDEDEDEDADGHVGMHPDGVTAEGGRRLRVGVDFKGAIASLPPTWDQHPSAARASQAESHPLEARRYADLATQLAALASRRRESRERVDRLRRMQALLAPFADAAQQVQPNLVTRNGEVEKELERMRVLLVRVAGRVAQLPDGSRGAGVDDEAMMNAEGLDALETAKVERLLNGF
ncbi:hypothetical protein DL764_004947 [Monosporascus ibericus]|uniref:Kinetochore protein fta4 n=1 Tax=Monosporascus ibericus TaxID=155417 RepID=A0A4Q4TEP1_9PEZI|nr:hypothetical protein DL764_004947 [Monosporascus ibericus]